MKRGINRGTASKVQKVRWRECPATPRSPNPVYRLIFYSLRHTSTATSARKTTAIFLQMQTIDGEGTIRSHISSNLKSTVKAHVEPLHERTTSQKVIGNFQKVIGRGARIRLKFTAYRGPIGAAGGADERHSYTRPPVASCLQRQAAPTSSQP